MAQLILILWVLWVFYHDEESQSKIESESVYNRHYDD